MAEKVAQFRFKGFLIKKSFIEINDENKISEKLSVDFDLSGENDKEKKIFSLTMKASITDPSSALLIEIIAIGRFEYDDQISDEHRDIYFYTSAPAILFPYIRAHVSTISNLSGINPITLPTLNMTQKGQELREHTHDKE